MPILIDGAYGEGGGQILRTALTLSTVTGRPLRIERIRANRFKVGLGAQHLTAVRAAAALFDGELRGDERASMELDFIPRRPVSAGSYTFDVASAREGGSAGSASLVLQTLLVPWRSLPARAETLSEGHAFTPQSLGRLPAKSLGEIRATIGAPPSQLARRSVQPLDLTDRGALNRIHGRAVAANLPSHS